MDGLDWSPLGFSFRGEGDPGHRLGLRGSAGRWLRGDLGRPALRRGQPRRPGGSRGSMSWYSVKLHTDFCPILPYVYTFIYTLIQKKPLT